MNVKRSSTESAKSFDMDEEDMDDKEDSCRSSTSSVHES